MAVSFNLYTGTLWPFIRGSNKVTRGNMSRVSLGDAFIA